jgi:hypothetical protein
MIVRGELIPHVGRWDKALRTRVVGSAALERAVDCSLAGLLSSIVQVANVD